jgi:hypothetical protein
MLVDQTKPRDPRKLSIGRADKAAQRLTLHLSVNIDSSKMGATIKFQDCQDACLFKVRAPGRGNFAGPECRNADHGLY